MLPFLSLTLAGGALFVGWRQHWRPPPHLIDVLAPSVVSPASPRQPLMRLYAGSPQQNLAFSVGLLGLTTVSYLGMPVLRLVTLPTALGFAQGIDYDSPVRVVPGARA